MKINLSKTLFYLGILLITSGVLTVSSTLWNNGGANQIVAQQQKEQAQTLSPVIVTNAETTIGNGVGEASEPFARMYVPSWGKDYIRPVYQGTSLTMLDKGIGHYPSTSLPEQVGNFAVAAHRTTVGANFYKIDELVSGDKIYVETNDALYEYTFINSVIVKPTEGRVLEDNPYGLDLTNSLTNGNKNLKILTMTSCNPKYSDAERIIAFSVQTAKYKPNEIPGSIKQEINIVQ